MTKKIDKKTRLDAMLHMWGVLREIHKTRPWNSNSLDFRLMTGLQEELGTLLGVSNSEPSYLTKKTILILLENLEKLKKQLEGRNLDVSSIESVIQLLRQSIGEIPTPASFENALPSPESA